MANYVGMKSILSKFWQKEQEKNDSKYATIVTVDSLDSSLASLKSEVEAKTSFEYEITSTIPEATKENTGKIWLVPRQDSGYTEYLVVKVGDTYKTEEIGDTQIDLSNYVQTVNSISVATGTHNVTLTASDILDDTSTSIQDDLDDHSVRLLAIENSDLDFKFNNVSAVITKDDTTQDISATFTVTGSDIPVSSTDTTTISAKFEGLTTSLAENYQTKLTDTQMSAVNSGITADKVSSYDTVVSDYLTSADITLTDKDFEDIFTTTES